MSTNNFNKSKIIKMLQKSDKDVGSSEVQIGILTERIKYLTKHFKNNKKDKHSNIGLSKMIIRRKKLLDYLNKKEPTLYKKVIEQLGLRK